MPDSNRVLPSVKESIDNSVDANPNERVPFEYGGEIFLITREFADHMESKRDCKTNVDDCKHETATYIRVNGDETVSLACNHCDTSIDLTDDYIKTEQVRRGQPVYKLKK